jgi:hypothetical protein
LYDTHPRGATYISKPEDGLPDDVPIEQASMNSCDDQNLVAAIERSGRKMMVLTSLWTQTRDAKRD